ncbi:O-antigen ligase [Acetoanaerobium pronyense]|uniref:O-antigen ligase n=1 Tax=Acetoanaerobium pronyense TaxID=1482736 RepID=A0ABS4KHG5_9FIRM|nr:O-antigen ligase family protein [Acetoanaerobium pronyense]MBP2027202.1 O-antigen ligase [Acetoanaerobium pronyense]
MNKDYIWITALVIGVILGTIVLSMIDPYMIAIFPAATFIGVIYLHQKELTIATSIIVLPLLTSTIFSMEILPVPGGKLNNILMMLLLIGFLLNNKLKFSDIKLGTFFYFISIILITSAVIRTNHVAPYSVEFWKEGYNPVKFFLSHGLIPILTTLPYLIIIGTVRTKKDIEKIVYYLAMSMGIFAIVILLVFVFRVPFGSDFSTVREIIGIDHLGMHGNNIADFFIVGFPLLLSMALAGDNPKRKWFLMGTAFSLMAVLIIYSRTAYAMIGFSVVAIAFLTKKYKILLPAVASVLIIVMLMPSVVNRALSDLDTGEANAITAGRTELIWGEILSELYAKKSYDPWRIAVGHGRYGVLSLATFRNQKMLRVTHAHNMYIDTLVDTGVLGLGFYILIYLYLLSGLIRKFIKFKKANDVWGSHLIVGLFVGILSFLFRGLTDSFLLPQLTNSYAYIFVAISFVVLRKDYTHERSIERLEETYYNN